MEKLESLESLKKNQFYDLHNQTIVATFERFLKAKNDDDWIENDSAIFCDIKTESGKRVAPLGRCNYGMLMRNVKPKRGEIFIFKNCTNVYGTIGEHIRFYFPKEIIGVNNNKVLVYNKNTKRAEEVYGAEENNEQSGSGSNNIAETTAVKK